MHLQAYADFIEALRSLEQAPKRTDESGSSGRWHAGKVARGATATDQTGRDEMQGGSS